MRIRNSSTQMACFSMAFSTSMLLFGSLAQAQSGKEAFYENCISTIDNFSSALTRLPSGVMDGYLLDSLWLAIGVDSGRIDMNIIGRDYNALVEPRDYVPSEERTKQICSGYQAVYDQYVGREVEINTWGTKVRRYVYEADAIEQERIPGTWAVQYWNIQNRELTQWLSGSLKTLFVTYRHVVTTNKVEEFVSCSVSFQILPENKPSEPVSLRDEKVEGVWTDSVDIIKEVVWGLPMLKVIQRTDPSNQVVLNYTGEYGARNGEVYEMISQSYSQFSGGLDWQLFEQRASTLAESDGDLVPITKIEDALPREANPLVQSPECVNALKTAREEYARASQ